VYLLLIAFFRSLQAQTYKVNSSPAQSQNNTTQTSSQNSGKTSLQRSLGWGSNIQNARLARAAEQALKSGNYSAALDYAQRAAEAAPEDPQLWFLLGYCARLTRKMQLSLDAYSHGLRLSPNSLDGLSGLAQTYSVMGKNSEAERLLNQVLSADPKRANDAQLLGEILLREGDYEKSISVLGRAEQAEPEARSELLMALDYQHLKQFDQADRYLEQARKRAPDNPEVQRSLAGFYRETGNYSAAIASLKTIPHKPPDILAELAYTYQLDGQLDKSAKLYSQAADAAPQDLNLQLSAGQAEVTAGATEAAQSFLQRAATLDSNYYRLHAIRGEIASREERDPDAIQEYNMALKQLPQAVPEGPLYRIQLQMNLVELYHRVEDDADSHQHLEIARSQIQALDERGPNRLQFLRLRALVKMSSGDLDGASQDINEALSLNSKDVNSLQVSGDLLAKMGRTDDAIATYKKILALDANNQLALTSLGFVSRTAGHDLQAEKYFQQLANAYPKLGTPYLALGDTYTARREFGKAEAEYRKGHQLAPTNAFIVAGGMNAAIEAHEFSLAGQWLKRADDQMQQNPYVMREKERYLRFIDDYQQSADVGEQAIKKLPHDRDVVVYLGYDWLYLQRYDELQQLTSRYDAVFPKDPDIPLLKGYVDKHAGQLELAQTDFTAALTRDPRATTAYVNRGYVRNDLHQAAAAASDFESALRLEPKNGEAHLGLAYASLTLQRPRIALRQAQLAEAQVDQPLAIHVIRATAYGQEGALTKAAGEYRTALKYSPNDPALHSSLANALYGLHRYREAIPEIETAARLSPNDSLIYAQLSRCYAQLHDKDNTLANLHLAEQHLPELEPKQRSQVLVSTGQALTFLGERDAAMQRFEQALTAPDSDRLEVRLAVARLMEDDGKFDDARRQIALGFMEAQTNQTAPPTGEQLLEAGDLFLAMHDFQLAQTYFQQALAAGAPNTATHIGLANTYLATGDTERARAEIASVGTSAASDPSYQLLLAQANILRQQHQNVQALTAFAQAAQTAGDDETAERELMQTAGDEGMRINKRLSVLSDFSTAGIFEDTTVYPLDARLDVPRPLPGRQSLLPLPRSSLETQWTGAYHLHFDWLPNAGGFFQVRNAQGAISLPSADAIVNRDTTDYTFNFGVNPTIHLGNNVLTFSPGLQGTIRRDSKDPLDMNQNLFRQFLYMSTSSFFNMVSVTGYAIRETGPFTESNLRSRDLSGALDFRVGRPWGKNFLLTGWGARDEQFFPVIREFYYTSVYLGLERRFSEKLDLGLVAEDVRAWRVEGLAFANSQALRPASHVVYAPTRNWSFEASVAYSRNSAFHAYDAVESGFAVSYAMPIHRTFRGEGQHVRLTYPIRFSAGMQQEDFFNFPGGGGASQQFRPYVRITIF
jgi:tetratricopeptide (TPR) repeat protein